MIAESRGMTQAAVARLGVAADAEAQELVVLADDLGGALGEVEGDGALQGAEVVLVEDEGLGEVVGVAPDDPPHARVDLRCVGVGGGGGGGGGGGHAELSASSPSWASLSQPSIVELQES